MGLPQWEGMKSAWLLKLKIPLSRAQKLQLPMSEFFQGFCHHSSRHLINQVSTPGLSLVWNAELRTGEAGGDFFADGGRTERTRLTLEV